jgi:predicted transcriptional regulator
MKGRTMTATRGDDKVRITVTIDAELDRRIEELARAQYTSKGAILRQSVAFFLAQNSENGATTLSATSENGNG